MAVIVPTGTTADEAWSGASDVAVAGTGWRSA
jgi:hypothetical protein